jgi:hypothetical protein
MPTDQEPTTRCPKCGEPYHPPDGCYGCGHPMGFMVRQNMTTGEQTKVPLPVALRGLSYPDVRAVVRHLTRSRVEVRPAQKIQANAHYRTVTVDGMTYGIRTKRMFDVCVRIIDANGKALTEKSLGTDRLGRSFRAQGFPAAVRGAFEPQAGPGGGWSLKAEYRRPWSSATASPTRR